MQKLAEEKKAEALKHMNSLPQVELDLKRHGPDGYHHGGCREPRGMSQSSNMTRHQHPKQVGGGESIVFIRLTLEPAGSSANVFYQQPLNWLLLCLVSRYWLQSWQLILVKLFWSENLRKLLLYPVTWQRLSGVTPAICHDQLGLLPTRHRREPLPTLHNPFKWSSYAENFMHIILGKYHKKVKCFI